MTAVTVLLVIACIVMPGLALPAGREKTGPCAARVLASASELGEAQTGY
jgi:hypothetical protein